MGRAVTIGHLCGWRPAERRAKRTVVSGTPILLLHFERVRVCSAGSSGHWWVIVLGACASTRWNACVIVSGYSRYRKRRSGVLDRPHPSTLCRPRDRRRRIPNGGVAYARPLYNARAGQCRRRFNSLRLETLYGLSMITWRPSGQALLSSPSLALAELPRDETEDAGRRARITN